jgi:IMP dehydrogenase
MKIKEEETQLDFVDVFLYPQYSEIVSRKLADTATACLGFVNLDTPVISANMDTITDGKMALAMYKSGAIGAIHRFTSIDEAVREYRIVAVEAGKCFVSVGVHSDAKVRTDALFDAGARYFIVDIAHGHSKMMKDMLEWMRQKYGKSIYIMAGNIATKEAAHDLLSWGANAVKIGIGPGGVCSTKNITGVTRPQWSAIRDVCDHKAELSKLKSQFWWLKNQDPVFVADGGIKEIGDVAKAIAAGADIVMMGKMLSNANETPGPRINGKKIYRGMASRDAMLTIRESSSLPTPEGISTLIEEKEEPVEDIIKRIKGGLQSSMSYTNASTLEQFRQNAIFGIRRR